MAEAVEGEDPMQFRSKDRPIPDRYFDNEVPVKKNPDDCYSKEFVERNTRRLAELKVYRDSTAARTAL